MDSYWSITRDTWMQQRGVCTLAKDISQRPGCIVYVTRVVGKPHGAFDSIDWAFLEEDILQLNIKENMNHGKTFYAFHALARAVPWATHIAKLDMDVYPYIYNLVSFLHSKQDCAPKYQWMGVPVKRCTDFRFRFCKDNDYPHDHLFWQNRSGSDLYKHCTSGECRDAIKHQLRYMQGGMYILSRSLAEAVTEPNGYYSKHKSGLEDMMMGDAVTNFMLGDSSPCVSVWYHNHENSPWHHEAFPEVDPLLGKTVKGLNWLTELAKRCTQNPLADECALPKREEA